MSLLQASTAACCRLAIGTFAAAARHFCFPLTRASVTFGLPARALHPASALERLSALVRVPAASMQVFSASAVAPAAEVFVVAVEAVEVDIVEFESPEDELPQALSASAARTARTSSSGRTVISGVVVAASDGFEVVGAVPIVLDAYLDRIDAALESSCTTISKAVASGGREKRTEALKDADKRVTDAIGS